ncbi:hypothetical protein [Reichenbachiella sp.]|uniref:hypothetical protein n=1 Tax=Reichenbachiella sp. TaxID=2184521 RepID=UPI0032995284
MKNLTNAKRTTIFDDEVCVFHISDVLAICQRVRLPLRFWLGFSIILMSTMLITQSGYAQGGTVYEYYSLDDDESTDNPSGYNNGKGFIIPDDQNSWLIRSKGDVSPNSLEFLHSDSWIHKDEGPNSGYTNVFSLMSDKAEFNARVNINDQVNIDGAHRNLLDLQSTNSTYASFTQWRDGSDNVRMRVGADGTDSGGFGGLQIGALGTWTDHGLGLFTNTEERIRVKSDGKVGINTTNPTQQLEVNGNIFAKGIVYAGSTSFNDRTEIGHGGSHGFVHKKGVGNLDFRLNGPTYMTLTDAGDLGIGTTAPEEKLHVIGDLLLQQTANSSSTHMKFISGFTAHHQALRSTLSFGYQDGNNRHNQAKIRVYSNGYKNGGRMDFMVGDNGQEGEDNLNPLLQLLGRSSGQQDDFTQANRDGSLLIVNADRMGIGTDNPEAKLEVNGDATISGTVTLNGSLTGDIEASGLSISGTTKMEYLFVKNQQVNPTLAFPDYVFANSYRLRTLKEVESFIDQNHHLPEVPSAKHISDHGYDVAEMDATLLKKIEELTLYMIEMKKENEALKAQLDHLLD